MTIHCVISSLKGLTLLVRVRKSTPRFTKSPSLVKINKEMFGHPDTASPMAIYMYFFVNFDIFKLAVSCILSGLLFYTKLGDFVKLGLHFMNMWINSC